MSNRARRRAHIARPARAQSFAPGTDQEAHSDHEGLAGSRLRKGLANLLAHDLAQFLRQTDIFLPAQTSAFLGTSEVVVERSKGDLPVFALNMNIAEARAGEEVVKASGVRDRKEPSEQLGLRRDVSADDRNDSPE